MHRVHSHAHVPVVAAAAAAAAVAAVRKLLELLQGSLGYDSICLFADKDKPHICAMYKVGLRWRCLVARAPGLWLCAGQQHSCRKCPTRLNNNEAYQSRSSLLGTATCQ
jgi:hypothetical protein